MLVRYSQWACLPPLDNPQARDPGLLQESVIQKSRCTDSHLVESRRSLSPQLLRRWARTGYLKAVVRCSGEDELLVLQGQAQSLSLCTRSIQDAYVTQHIYITITS